MTVALHVGDVLYGNFGGEDRLDFTVVGPAVNELSRIAGMVRVVDQPAILSAAFRQAAGGMRSEEHTSELQSLMRISYAVFFLKKKIKNKIQLYQQIQ